MYALRRIGPGVTGMPEYNPAHVMAYLAMGWKLPTMSLDQLIELQRELGLGDRHLVQVREDGFDIAHTDEERVSGMDLHYCEVHRRMDALDGPPDAPGVYGEPDFIEAVVAAVLAEPVPSEEPVPCSEPYCKDATKGECRMACDECGWHRPYCCCV